MEFKHNTSTSEGKSCLQQEPKERNHSRNLGCFGFSRLVTIAAACKPQNKGDEFHKLLHSSRLSQLEQLYYEHKQRSHKRQMANVLLQILQIQEVKSVKEYTVNGNSFIVHVVEDTDL